MSNKLCIVSHSGGLDSSTLIAKAAAEGYIVQPINFNYGQKNLVETVAQKNVLKIYRDRYGKERILEPLSLDFNNFMASSLESFKTLRDSGDIDEATGLEYYMPFRNMVFTSVCAMIGELIALHKKDIKELAIGIGIHKHSDVAYSKDYWDITPEFAKRINDVLSLNDTFQVGVFAPYAESYKEDIIRDAIDLDVPYLNTWTCYDPVFEELTNETIHASPCRKCEACIERDIQGQKAGVDDINEYYLEIDNTVMVKQPDMDLNEKTQDYFGISETN